MSKYQEAKRRSRDYFDAMENATHENVADVLKAHTSEDYLWRAGRPIPRARRRSSCG